MGCGVNRASSYRQKKLSVYAIKRDSSERKRTFVQFAESIHSLLFVRYGEMDKHPTTPGSETAHREREALPK